MRLSPTTVETIRGEVTRRLGSRARVWLFGSRADDQAQGGDIDIYVETDEPIANRASTASRLAAALQLRLGDQRIDVILVDPNTAWQPVHSTAKESGVRL